MVDPTGVDEIALEAVGLEVKGVEEVTLEKKDWAYESKSFRNKNNYLHKTLASTFLYIISYLCDTDIIIVVFQCSSGNRQTEMQTYDS